MDRIQDFIFQDKEYSITINLFFDNNEIWLKIEDIAKVFSVSRTNILFHLKKLSEEGKKVPPTCQNFLQVRQEGDRKVTRKIKVFNLETVLEIGYRLKSKRGVLLKNLIEKELFFNQEKLKENTDIIIYNNGLNDIPLKFSVDKKTIWGNQEQIALLFETTRSNVARHIQNIFQDEELDEKTICEFSSHIGSNGHIYKTILYNLDMILAVGYRVKTSKAITFRNWASQILSQYILNGYVINEARCLECKDNIINLQERIYKLEQLSGKELTYYSGDELRGFIEIKRFLEGAKEEIIIIDNYFGNEFDEVLEKINVKKIIITNIKNKKIENNSLYEVIKINNIHDRFIMVDSICYHFGSSPKDLGEKMSNGHLITDQKVIEFLKNYTKEEKHNIKED